MKNALDRDYNDALKGLSIYNKWFTDHQRDVSGIMNRVIQILNKLRHSSGEHLKHFSISYAGIPNAGVQIWAWQMNRSLPAAMAHFTNIMLIEVGESSMKITYFDLKPHSIHEWWKYRTIYNPSEKEIDEAIRWVSTIPSPYPDWESDIPWHRRIINQLKWKFFIHIGWIFGI